MEAIVSKAADISNESQILDNVMEQYRSKRSNDSNNEKLLKIESDITEEQWFNMIALLDLRNKLPLSNDPFFFLFFYF